MGTVTFRDSNTRIALLTTLSAAIDAELKAQRADHLEVLLEEYERNGSKNFTVSLPDAEVGDDLGQIILKGTPEQIVASDEAALLEWALEHAPGMVETVTIPPQPEQTFQRIHANSLAALKKRVVRDPETGELRDGDLVVDGLQYRKPGKPNSFQVKLSEAGKERLLDAYRAGSLAELVASTPALQLGQQAPDEEVAPWE